MLKRDIGKLIARLSGYNRPSEDAAISALISQVDDDLIDQLRTELAKSHWPLCDSLATALGRIGTQHAKLALTDCLKARNKHVRVAAIKGLVITADPAFVHIIEPFLSDSSMAGRVAAKEAIHELTGRNVKTSRGE